MPSPTPGPGVLPRLEYSKAPPLTTEMRARIRAGVLSLGWKKGDPRGSRNGGAYRSIYVIECGEFVKVGYASDVHARLAGIMVDNPFDARLRWHRTVPSYYAIVAERGAHYGLAEYRHRNEWFRAHPALAAKVVTAACQETKRIVGLRQTAIERERRHEHSHECAAAWLRETEAFLTTVAPKHSDMVTGLAKRAASVRRHLRERGVTP